MKKRDIITIAILIGMIALILSMIKSFQIECEKRQGKTVVGSANIRGIDLECIDQKK